MLNQGVTVIIPTLNRSPILMGCLSDLIAQTHRPLQLLVVDQSDYVPSNLLDFVEKHQDLITYIRSGPLGLPKARNYGWQSAKYEALLFVDDDVRCSPDLVTEHLKTLTMLGVGIVAGGIDELRKASDPGPPTGKFWRWTATPLRGFAALGEQEVEHAPGGNFSVWRAVLDKCGGVDELFSEGAALYEETDLCLRAGIAGYRIYFNGHARVTHLASPRAGCRVPDINRYIRGLAHNRTILIRRHLSWYHVPFALARLALLALSHARACRAPRALVSCVVGCVKGFQADVKNPRVSYFKSRETYTTPNIEHARHL